MKTERVYCKKFSPFILLLGFNFFIYICNSPTTRTKLIIVSFIGGEFINLFDGIDVHFFFSDVRVTSQYSTILHHQSMPSGLAWKPSSSLLIIHLCLFTVT